MSVSIYLICDETEHYVRIGDTKAHAIAGAYRPAVVAAFGRAHAERPLRTSLESPEWRSGNLGEEWTLESAGRLYRAVTGFEMPTLPTNE